MLRKFVVYTALVLLSFGSTFARAEEPIERFLSALRERGHFGVALRYLDRMATSDLASPSFKEEIEYIRGMLLVDSARSTKNASTRKANLDVAQKSFATYIASNPQGESSAIARNQLSVILVERARGLMAAAESDETNRRRITEQAAEIYAEAYESLVTSRAEIGNQYKALAGKRDPESKAKLTAVMSQYVETNWLAARVLFEQADTIKDDANLYKEKLTEAATAFEEVAQKYRLYTAGIYALLYEGQCYQLMGEHRRAITYFKELLQNSDNTPQMRQLKTQAVARSIESQLAVDRNGGPDKSIAMAQQWMKTRRGDEDRTPAWMEFRLELARAYKQKSTVETKDAQAARALNEARSIAGELARRSSPVQKEAQKLLVALGRGKTKKVSVVDAATAKSFDEAREAARKSLEVMKLSTATVSILSSQLENINDPGRRAEIESKLEVARQQSTEMSKAALESFERAAVLATDDDLDELNGVRYYLAYLYYSQQQYRRAAILAGFVALEHSDSAAAKECASVALAARQRLYQQATPAERDVQSAQIGKIAELMTSKWPGDPQSATALMTLLDVSLQRGELEKAEEYLGRIPEDSPKRASAELRIGQSIWREYLRRIASGQSGESAEEPVNLERFKSQALHILAKGIDRRGKSAPDESSIRAALSLAQIYVDSGKAADALDILRHDRLGALTLVEANSPWVKRIAGLATEAYKTSIRAHVASAPQSGDTEGSIDAAQKMLDRLRKELQQQPDGHEKMIGIYVGLARDLERQLRIAPPKDRRALSKGFESFLRGAAEGTKDIVVLNWVGETFYSLGRGMLEGTKSTPEAQRYFTEAASAYGDVLSHAKGQPGALSENALTQVKVRQAMSLRQLGKYRDSVDLFANVLGQRNKVLNIQIEAAKTLQQWGSSGNADGYQKAILGAKRGADGKNSIWGWGRIANLVSKNEAYRDTFHEARYNIALSRYRYAMSKSGKQREDLFRRATSDILVTKQLFGLGNKAQEQRYQVLLESIQKSLSGKATGFSESK